MCVNSSQIMLIEYTKNKSDSMSYHSEWEQAPELIWKSNVTRRHAVHVQAFSLWKIQQLSFLYAFVGLYIVKFPNDVMNMLKYQNMNKSAYSS